MKSYIKWSIPSDAEEPNVSHVMTAYPNAYYTIPFYYRKYPIHRVEFSVLVSVSGAVYDVSDYR